ncbi:MAG: phosphomannomutase/phosphoglucomutase [Methanophagales archaeon]|nr:phosphomannomutase/phosphoglucomutase [Methanophagales archaeon]
MSIFKAYDIRGTYPSEIDKSVAYQIGTAFGILNQGNGKIKIAVGCDTRLSGPELKENFIKGLISRGSNYEVIDIGIVTTPILVFAIKHFNCDGGVNITASHNPKEYNGFKFFDKAAIPVSYESGISKLKVIFDKDRAGNNYDYDHHYHNTDNGSYSYSAPISVTKRTIKEDYIKFILEMTNTNMNSEDRFPVPVVVVIDGSNGSAGLYAPEIHRRAGMTVYELNCTPDGAFPGHDPDPSKEENLAAAKEKVKEVGAAIGFVFDGDGDRLAVIDEAGTTVESSRIFSLLTSRLLEENPGAKIVHDILTSRMVIDTINNCGGQAIPCRVGHTYIAQKMMAEDAELGGELSGHYYFKETFFADDAILASLKIVELLISNSIKLSELVKDFPEYLSENLRISVKESKKFPFITKLKRELEEAGYLLDCLDGVKVIFEDGWVIFRASNTEPKISIVYESSDKRGYNRLKDFVQSIIRKVPQ